MYVAIHVNAMYEKSLDGWNLTGVFQSWEAVSWFGKERASWANGVSASEMFSWLKACCKGKKQVTVWGWNIWPMVCLSRLVNEINEKRFVLDVSGDRPKGCFIAADPPTIIKVQTPEGCTLKFIDLANFGIEPSDYSVDGNAGKLAATKQAVMDYCQLCYDWEMGPPASTAASQAWKCYKAMYEPPSQWASIPPISAGQSRLEEAAYFGGRCECVRLGSFTDRLYHLDISSMYTAIGRNAMFPRAYVTSWDRHNGSTAPPYATRFANAFTSDYLAIADVTLRTPENWYPVSDLAREHHINELWAPAVRSVDERVIWPIGEFRTALCGPELALAVASNHVKEWHRVQYYEPEALMADWSKFALAMREGVKRSKYRHLSRCAKKIINSLPGKWGQREKVWVDYDQSFYPLDHWGEEHGAHPVTGAMTQFRIIAGKCQYLDGDNLAKDACPAVAAYWTSYGRMALLSMIIQAGWLHTYYYDTDSLIVDYQGFISLEAAGFISPGGLDKPGKLRIVADDVDTKILGIRRYYHAGKWHVAGPPIGDIHHQGFGRQLWKHNVGESVANIEYSHGIKNYKHGVVKADGSIEPFRIEE